MLIGPHSPFGNQSLFAISESQAGFAMTVIDHWRQRAADILAPTVAATDDFNARLREGYPNTTWATGCDSWYIGADGLPHAWPFSPQEHRDLLKHLEPGHWELTHHRDQTPAGATAAP